jgi:hypothetical protein
MFNTPIRIRTEAPQAFPKFTFCWNFRQRPNVWHIRDASTRDTTALCKSDTTCDVSLEVTLERMQGHCAVCAAACCQRLVAFCQPREVLAIPVPLPKAA